MVAGRQVVFLRRHAMPLSPSCSSANCFRDTPIGRTPTIVGCTSPTGLTTAFSCSSCCGSLLDFDHLATLEASVPTQSSKAPPILRAISRHHFLSHTNQTCAHKSIKPTKLYASILRDRHHEWLHLHPYPIHLNPLCLSPRRRPRSHLKSSSSGLFKWRFLPASPPSRP